jgi:hypothetical protein
VALLHEIENPAPEIAMNFVLQSETLRCKVHLMSSPSPAEEHLRIIRSLMERATIYRAISAPGALVGGVVSVLLLAVVLLVFRSGSRVPFFPVWLAVLAFTAAVNFFLLRREAHRRGDEFFSPGMRLALRAMLPALLGGALCAFIEGEGGYTLNASLWVLCYGISLLAASHFAPRSICWLGRAFFVAGAGLLLGGAFVVNWWQGTDEITVAHVIMGGTFGLFHLVYAACTWPRRASSATSEGVA